MPLAHCVTAENGNKQQTHTRTKHSNFTSLYSGMERDERIHENAITSLFRRFIAFEIEKGRNVALGIIES